MSTYNFSDIEKKWQQIWETKKSFSTPEPSAEHPPYFMLVMFPYPSGNLHMGHVRNYTIGDVLARFYRRQGRAVLHPIGWDSFGLPAENAAIQRKTDPAKWTWSNIAVMRGQLKALAISYDWDREVATCDPTYYRWNQWIFIKFLERGLAYRKKAPVNWCNSCNTVLANEQVHDGKCWRCDTLVVQKELEQWFFKITEYAEELLTGHEKLKPTKDQKGWPPQVLTMQSNWIGKSWGAHVDFSLHDSPEKIRVFTTRPDTLFGATFMVLAPEHPLVEKITTPDRKKSVEQYRSKAKSMTHMDRTSASREKTGEFTGSYAINPLTNNRIPIWVADYVLTDYGTGAIMAVPAHDERDFQFAKKYSLNIIQVIQPTDETKWSGDKAFEEEGVLVNSGEFNGLSTEDAKFKVADFLRNKDLGGPAVTYKLRDWLLSRQRYWGTPIPIIYCPSCGAVPVPLSELPVTLPTNVEFTGTGASPLTQAHDWINTPCPTCKKPAKRETDTMDTFVDSSWYYARYTDAKNTSLPFGSEQVNKWTPVHQYVGGIEHACMHLIYSRFFHKALRDMGMVASDEPFASLLTQGMVTLGGSAMSKSKGNVVDPNDVIQRYGADTCRLFILFAAPPTQQLEWSDKQIEGIWRFLNRVWRLAQCFTQGNSELPKRTLDDSSKAINKDDLMRLTHLAIKKVTHDIKEDFGFNTAIATVMELVNAVYLYNDWGDETSKFATESILHLLSPFAPHFTEELWENMGHKSLLGETPWPKFDESKIQKSTMEIIVQVNGKLKEKVTVETTLSEDAIKNQALEVLQKKGNPIHPQRVVYIPRKLINFVVSESAKAVSQNGPAKN